MAIQLAPSENEHSFFYLVCKTKLYKYMCKEDFTNNKFNCIRIKHLNEYANIRYS